MSTEHNLNLIDGSLNNQSTTAELEAKTKGGETISLSDLAGAIKAERGAVPEARSADAKPSIREQLVAGKEQLSQKRAAAPQRAAAKSKELEV